jgi:hypothetical protein
MKGIHIHRLDASLAAWHHRSMRGVGLWVVLVGVGLLSSLATTGCARPCTSSANCVRTCDCLNSETNTRQDCSVAFRCDGAERVCEAAHESKSCDEICAEYAGNARCGVERCANDAECAKTIECPLIDQNGNATGQFATCTLGFRCQADFEACQPRSTAQEADLCQNECVSGVIADEP